MITLAIDPGNVESAYVLIGADYRPISFEKLRNDELLNRLRLGTIDLDIQGVAIEMVASYGMAVGADVFETCVWIGRFYQVLASTSHEPQLVKRLPVKTHHCHSAKATDANIRQALVDRFALGQPNHGKGTKNQPGWFHKFHSDVWAAYALAVYIADLAKEPTDG
jgi:hypothetical protein